mgnify:CR=1 FL=1
MNISVRAKPRSKKDYVKQFGESEYVVAVKEPPVDGRANKAIIEALADYFNIKKSEIILISGIAGRLKIFSIPDFTKSPTLF